METEWDELAKEGVFAPAAIEEAEARITATTVKLQGIQAQLSNRDRRDADGRRMNDWEYQQWRTRAVWAMTHTTRELRALKVWRRRELEKRRALTLPAGGTDYYLLQALRILGRVLERHAAILTEVEQSAIDEAKVHLKHIQEQRRLLNGSRAS